jgi:hypothetical protein
MHLVIVLGAVMAVFLCMFMSSGSGKEHILGAGTDLLFLTQYKRKWMVVGVLV